MSEDGIGPVLLVVLLGGLAVWWILNRKNTPSAVVQAPPPTPCNIGGAYAGFGASVPCSAVKTVLGDASMVFNPFATSNNVVGRLSKAQAQRLADDGNNQGIVATETNWGSAGRLPSGGTNVIEQKPDGTWTVIMKFGGYKAVPPAPTGPAGAPPAVKV